MPPPPCARSVPNRIRNTANQQYVEETMDGREQQMQRNEANRPKVIPAIENRTRTPDQVMAEYRACAQHEEYCDAEHR